jgi:hypothetical protein
MAKIMRIKPLILSLGLTLTLSYLGSLHLAKYQQLKMDSKIASQQSEALIAQTDYQHWLTQIATIARPVRQALELDFSIGDWLHELEDWQTRYQQAWPEVVYEQTEPAFAWQQFRLQKQMRITNYNDYQAWQSWQSRHFNSEVLPQSCRWQAHLNKSGNDFFIGSIDCEWQVNLWQGVPGLAQVIATTEEPESLPVLPNHLVSQHILQEQPEVLFMGVMTDKQERYVNIGGSWILLPAVWCQWTIAQYDGQVLILTNVKDPGFAQHIRLGQSLPNC